MSETTNTEQVEQPENPYPGVPLEVQQFVNQSLDLAFAHLRHQVTEQLNAIITNPVILGSLTANVMHRAYTDVTNAIRNSTENRAPNMVVSASYIAGSARVQLTENGLLYIWHLRDDYDLESQDLPQEEDWVAGGDDHPIISNQIARDAVAATLIAFGAQPDRQYYLTTDVDLQKKRDTIRELFLQIRKEHALQAG